jgi:hypothetical protein
MSIAALVLLFASGSQVLLDEVVEIPASQWRFAAVSPSSAPNRLECDYRVISGGASVRVILMDREEFKQWNAGNRELLEAAEPSTVGVFARLVHAAEEYEVVLANGGAKGPIRVALRVTEHRLSVSQLSTERRFAVIVISVSVFLAIVIYSGRKLRAAMGNG